MSNVWNAARSGFAVLLVLARGAGAVEPPAPAEPGSADDAYALHFIGFDDFGGVVSDRGRPSGTVTWTQAYEGKYKVPLDGARFYEKLGRLDLAQAYRRREEMRAGLQVGGVVTAIAATGLAIGAAASRGADPGRAPDPALLGGALGATVASCALFWVASTVDPEPISAPEARRLADDYNRQLKARLSPPAAAEKDGLEVRVTPTVLPAGAGVVLAMRF